MMLLLIRGILVAAVAGVGTTAALTVGGSSGANAAVRTATVSRGVVQSTVTASGNVQAPESITVNFPSTGRLTGVYVKAGQHVRRGEVAASLGAADHRPIAVRKLKNA